MNLYKELLDFLEANNWLSLEDEENAKGVIASYIKVYRPKLHKGQSLPIDSVSQQSELVCDHNLMPKQPSDATDYCVCTKCGQYVKQTCC